MNNIKEEILNSKIVHTENLPVITLKSDFISLAKFYVALEQRQSHYTVLTQLLRQDLLIVHTLAWENLWYLKSKVLRDPTDTSSWFARLTRDLRAWVVHQGSPLQLDLHRYLPNVFGSYQPFTISPKSLVFPKENGGDLCWAVNQAENCVLSWMGIPNKDKNRISAVFTRTLLDLVGPEILLVDAIWQALWNLPKLVMAAGDNKQPEPELLVAKIQESLDLICNQEEVDELLGHIHTLCSDQRTPDSRATLDILTTLASHKPLSALVSLSSPSPQAPPPPDHTPIEQSPQLDTWVDQLSLCLALLSRNGDGPLALPELDLNPSEKDQAIHKFLTEIMEEPDQRSPFREYAPSRYRVRTFPNGPFSSPNLRTVSGFFSVCVARLITHATRFLQDYPPFFRDLRHWKTVIEQALRERREPLDGEYFCRPDAYGQHTGDSRSVANAATLWESCQKGKLNGWLLRDKPITFCKLLMLLSSNKFPGIGRLTALQIAVDYAKAGVVHASEVDFVHTLQCVNKGAVGGLRNLQYLATPPPRMVDGKLKKDTRQPKLGDLQKAYSEAWVDLEGRWDSGKFSYNQYDFEHWLCKTSVKRLGRASYCNIYN